PAPAAAEASFEIPLAAPEEAVPAAPATHEVDLSAEWNMAAPAEEAAAEFPIEAAIPTPAGFSAEEVAQEIEFYLTQGLLDQARAAIARYRTDFPDEGILDELSARVEAAAPAAEEAVAEEPAEQVAEIPLEMETAGSVAEIPLEPEAAEPAPEEEEAEPAAAQAAAAEEGDTYEVMLEEPAKEPAAAGAPMSASDFFSDLAGDLNQALEGAQAPPPAPAAKAPRAARPGAPPPPAAEEATPVGVLQEVFDEFKEAMGGQEEDVDIESHYNLGIAYKEMGLLDEAISEFQKVTKAAERLKSHNQIFQACTLLGLCFMDKGHPQIAVRWYERALKTPGVDEEGQLALRYDMGTAHEQAGNRKAALDCFMEVYGVNVDYRDVSDRIRELQGA
ncbi:MAG: tetratricopeptide repeat protein, partial [Candidatus Acidiferrales bacterium]